MSNAKRTDAGCQDSDNIIRLLQRLVSAVERIEQAITQCPHEQPQVNLETAAMVHAMSVGPSISAIANAMLADGLPVSRQKLYRMPRLKELIERLQAQSLGSKRRGFRRDDGDLEAVE